MEWTAVARGQAGHITRTQLNACGVAARTIDNWLATHRLEATGTDGVYRVGGAPSTPQSPAWFAALSTRSPLSYLSAARWWEIEVPDDGWVHITRLDRRRLDWPPGVRVHRVALDPSAITQRRGLPVTTRRETLLDCLGWLPLRSAGSLADRAVQQAWLRPQDVAARLADQPGRWGNRQLRRLLAHLGDGAAAASERVLHRLLRDAGICGWVPNLSVLLGGRRFELDVAFPELKIAIEVDGWRYHSGDDRFQADRTKQNALVAAGWTVLRFTWADLIERPGYVLAAVRQLLAA